MNPDLYLWMAGCAALLVGLSKGGIPAIGMLAVPLLSLVMSPVKAAVLLLPIFVISDILGIWLYRRDYSAPNLRILIPAGIVGVVVGWLTASMVSDRAINFMIGSVGVAFCLNVWLRNQGNAHAQAPDLAKGWFWGSLAGFTSFISHAGAPPFQVYMLPQKLPKTQFAGTATIVFAVINAAKVLPYQNLRPYSEETLWSAAALIPFALVGAVCGAYLTRRIADVWFYRAVQISLFLVSVKLIANAVQAQFNL
jgi:uncharacterized membrane protein YfcA